jgi:regulator of cell morphogenesis and NO signaling
MKNVLIAEFCDQCEALDTQALVELIVKRFHNPHDAQMSSLIDQARYIEKKYVDHDSCPVGLTKLLMEFFDDLAIHMRQEEMFFFPALIKAGNANLFSQLAVFHHSHDRHQNMMERLCSLTNNLAPPVNAPDRWRQLYEDLAEFAFQLQLHIAVENRFLLND